MKNKKSVWIKAAILAEVIVIGLLIGYVITVSLAKGV